MCTEEKIIDWIIGNEIATEDEVDLVCRCFGTSVENLNKIIYCKTSFHDMEQCITCAPNEFPYKTDLVNDDNEEEEE